MSPCRLRVARNAWSEGGALQGGPHVRRGARYGEGPYDHRQWLSYVTDRRYTAPMKFDHIAIYRHRRFVTRPGFVAGNMLLRETI